MTAKRLAGRAALVTGAGRRIGATVAHRLATEGCDVVIHYRSSREAADRVAEGVRSLGVRATTVAGDLGKDEDRRDLVARAQAALGRPIDLIVNNASTFPLRRLDELQFDDLVEDLQVNAWAPFELSMSMARLLPPEATGRVVNFLDARIVDEDRRHLGYHLAKRMLADFTRLLALELAPRITVNGVAPGPTLPPPGTPSDEGDALMERLRQRLPLRRPSTPDDLADAVAYLAGAPAVTGQVLFVDGGRHLGRQPASGSDSAS